MTKKIIVMMKCDEVDGCGCGNVFPVEISGIPTLTGRVLKAAKVFQKQGDPIEYAFLKLALTVDGIMKNVDFENAKDHGRRTK